MGLLRDITTHGVSHMHQIAARKPKVTRKAYSINELCEILGISRATYYRMVTAGQIHPVAIGGCTRIPQHELDRLLGAPESAKLESAVA